MRFVFDSLGGLHRRQSALCYNPRTNGPRRCEAALITVNMIVCDAPECDTEKG